MGELTYFRTYLGTPEPQQAPEPKPPRYILGLDLGQRADYSALTLLEVHGEAHKAVSHCRHIKRYRLNTSYPIIAEDVRQLCQREPLINNTPLLGIDATGVGISVLDIFRNLKPAINAHIAPIQIHGGYEVTQSGFSYNVPKA